MFVALALLAATPANVNTVLTKAQSGDTVVLAPGNYGPIRADDKTGVTLDARGATVERFTTYRGSGWRIIGGTFAAPRIGLEDSARTTSITFNGVSGIVLDGVTVKGAVRGVGISRSDGVAIHNLTAEGIRVDGVDFAGTSNVLVDGVTCRSWAGTIPWKFGAAGNVIKDGDHPDCVQFWGVGALVHDVVVRNVTVAPTGYSQGVFLNTGTFARVSIKGTNCLSMSWTNCVYLSGARDSTVAGTRATLKPDLANSTKAVLNRAPGCVGCSFTDNTPAVTK